MNSDRRENVENIAGLRVRGVPAVGPARGRPVLFIHGMWAGAWFWEGYQRLFADRGYPSHALDLRGRPGSRPVPDIGKVGVRDYLADARAVAEALGNPALVGHSLGGLLALKLAELLDPPAVVALTPAPPRGVWAVRSREMLTAGLGYLPRVLLRRPIAPVNGGFIPSEVKLLPPEERERVFRLQVPESGRVVFDIGAVGLPVSADRIGCPLLLLGAGRDQVTPAGMVRRIARKYRAEYREYPGFGHKLVLEPGWPGIAGDILDWLDGLGGNAHV